MQAMETLNRVLGTVNQQSTELILTSYGGHMGYFGLDQQGRHVRWMEYFVIEQLRAKLAQWHIAGPSHLSLENSDSPPRMRSSAIRLEPARLQEGRG